MGSAPADKIKNTGVFGSESSMDYYKISKNVF
jgi:hypothetical protein